MPEPLLHICPHTYSHCSLGQRWTHPKTQPSSKNTAQRLLSLKFLHTVEPPHSDSWIDGHKPKLIHNQALKLYSETTDVCLHIYCLKQKLGKKDKELSLRRLLFVEVEKPLLAHFWDRVFVTQASLKLREVFLSQPPKFWDYKHVLLCPVRKSLINNFGWLSG